MMPGEKQADAGGVASEATSGTCENCALLHGSLEEYMAALLTLKQKIIDTDHLLSEYKEKCDELQKSQRESSKLHTQLEEVLQKLNPLEKQAVDFEVVKAELEETKVALKSYQQKSEEVDGLREENARTLALNEKLKCSLQVAEDGAKTQSLENVKLRSEKEILEGNLQKTQDSLSTCQQAVEEVENLRVQNAKTLIVKSNLENQLLVLEETKLKQQNEITDLKNKNCRLEENLHRTQEKLEKLEKEFKKEKRSIAAQTELEPAIDKAKVRMLLEELWHCMEPLSQTTEMLDLNENQHLSTISKISLQRCPLQSLPLSPSRRQLPKSSSSAPAKSRMTEPLGTVNTMMKVSPKKCQSKASLQEQHSPSREQRNKHTRAKRKMSPGSEEHNQSSTRSDHASDQSLGKDCWRNITDVWEILDYFKTLPALLSPLRHSNEPAELDDDLLAAGKKESSLSTEGEKSAINYTEPNTPVEDAVVTPLVNASPGSSSKSDLEKTEVSLVHDTGNEATNSLLSDTQEMEVEELCKVKEESKDLKPSEVPSAGLESGHQLECVTTKPVAILTESQLNTVEDHMNDISVKPQCVGSEIPKALCNDVISKCSDSSHQLVKTDHKCLDDDDQDDDGDKAAECLYISEAIVSDDHSEIHLNSTRHATKESERSVEKIQGSWTSESTTNGRSPKTTENQNGVERKEHASSSTKISEISSEGPSKSEEISDEEEFFGLRRKVRGIVSKPKNSLENVDNLTLSVEKQKSGKQKIHSGTEEGGQFEISKTELVLENKDAACSEDKYNSGLSCEPLLPKDNTMVNGKQDTASAMKQDKSVNLPQNSLQIIDAHNNEGENTPSGPSKTINGNVYSIPSSDLQDQSSEAMDLSIKPHDSILQCPVVQIPVALSGMEKKLNPSPLTVFASRDAVTSSPSSDSIGRVRTEMGPPLPPVVMPLMATPPKHYTPIRPSAHLPVWLPSEGPFTPRQAKSSLEPSLQHEAKRSPFLTTPSPSNEVPSSPLQFGSATPKHAVPVPGRLPSSALNSQLSTSPTASQENSMQMLDTMYPELSAQARTLNILRGNVNLGRGGSESGTSPPSVNQISGNKTINSSSTAFTKTEQKVKRTGPNLLLPKSAKKLRLDGCSPSPVNFASPVPLNNGQPTSVTVAFNVHPANPKSPTRNSHDCHELGTESKPTTKTNEIQISEVMEKLQKSCFDVLPVIKSHVFLGRISEVPVLRDEEKSVISDFCSNQWSTDEFMSVILAKLKAQRGVWKQELLQSIFRVFTGLCRQRGEVQKAHSLAYSLLKENFSEASKLILFMVTTWPSILSYESSLCKAIHTVCKLRAEGEILEYLTAYLHWDKSPPDNIFKTITKTLKALLLDGNLKFLKHDRHGEDLCPTAWEYIFTLDLLCAHLGWKWTHDNIIRKELWQVLDAWVTQPRLQQTPVRDVSVAAVMRLIGRLGQLGIKEKTCQSVQNVAKAINLFGKHAVTQGVSWEVQLSAIYTIYDLAPSNPKDALEALASWRGETTQPVPLGVTSCITQIGCLCRQIKP